MCLLDTGLTSYKIVSSVYFFKHLTQLGYKQ